MDTYYNPEDLAKFGTIGEKAPELAEKFFSYYNAVFEEGALTAREKSLIALDISSGWKIKKVPWHIAKGRNLAVPPNLYGAMTTTP